MTVSYNLDVSTSTVGAFLRLQFRWRGSIWKSVLKVSLPIIFGVLYGVSDRGSEMPPVSRGWMPGSWVYILHTFSNEELTMFLTAFAIITTIYRTNHFLSAEQRRFWDDFAALFDAKLDYIPLTFMLGFFVTIIVGRWNEIFNSIGWVDNTALLTATYLRGNDEKSRMTRRNIIRYMVLAQVLVFRDVSLQVRRRFPSLETLVAGGLMTEVERVKYISYNMKYPRLFLPIQWCLTLIYEARVSGKLNCDLMMNEIIKHVMDFRRGLAQLCNFDWVPIPLVYPQVVFLAVRSYFFLCLIARQSVLIDGEPPKDNNPVFPMVPLIMTALQFIFYVGWMKVAESLMNPLGEDDDDFECNYLLDRNLSVGLSIVDECFNDLPAQYKDAFWSTEIIEPLYSAEAAVKPMNPQIGSAAHFAPREDEVIMMPHVGCEDVEDVSTDDPEARLLPRGVSVVSMNRQCGSRSSLTSRKGVFDSIRKQFSRDGRKVIRPNRLNISQMTLNNEAKPTVELLSESSLDILSDLADEAARNSTFLTPKVDLSPTTPQGRSPVNEALTSVPEEDEENQKTRNSVDLKQWKEKASQESEK